MAILFAAGRFKATDKANEPIAGAFLSFYAVSTSTFQPVYADPALLTPLTNPVKADANGLFSEIWLDDSLPAYKVVHASPDINDPTQPGSIIWTILQYNNLVAGAALAEAVEPFLNPLTTEEQAQVLAANIDFSYRTGNIRRYGALANGTVDDSDAIRIALNCVPVQGGRVYCDPPGKIKVAKTVYIPQREATGHGIELDFTGSTLIGLGQGNGVIFESGTGALSSATNFGQPNETASSIHQHARISGGTFAQTGTAIRLFNWLKGCSVEHLFFQEVDTAIYTLRSFYLEVMTCAAVVTAITAGKILFNFDGLCNAMRITNCTAAGGGSNTTGIGFQFLVGGAIVFKGNTAEALDTGLKLAATVQGLDIGACYFEGCTTAGIDASGAGTKQMDIHDSFFNGVAKAITAMSWISGTWSASNVLVTNDIVEILDATSACVVEIPTQFFTEATAIATAVSFPSNYTLPNSVILRAPRVVYAASGGPNNAIALDGGANRHLPEFYYSGGPVAEGASYLIPFVTAANTSGSSTLDSQILWSDLRMAVIFDITGDIGGGGSIHLYGFVFANNNVFRCDGSSATWSVTASSSSGNLRLTIGGSGLSGKTMTGWNGQIRHV